MILEVSGLSKSFGAHRALESVDLKILQPEVHVLLGENGAGKSTLLKILSGSIKPDSGSIKVENENYSPMGPLDALKRGVAMIYQELTLVPHLTVEENVLLGFEPARSGWIDRDKSREMVRAVLSELEHPDFELNVKARELSIAHQQVIEIARAIIHRPKILIMDEPTSSLMNHDKEVLFRLVGKLKSKGVSILYVSHFLEECQRIGDRFTVLRDGKWVGSGDIKTTKIPEIIRMMVGREVEDIYPEADNQVGEVVYEVSGVCGRSKPSDVSFQLHAGEVFGLAGLIGSGRTETLRCLFGLDDLSAGNIRLNGSVLSFLSPRHCLKEGVGLLSENRKEEGLAIGRSVLENMTLTKLIPFSRYGLIRKRDEQKVVQEWIQELRIKARSEEQPVVSLSGGNQQKVALARLLHHDCRVLLLDEPTRGIDVGSKSQIYRLIQDLAKEGRAVIFVSSYIPELLGVCHRIGVMCQGRLVEIRQTTEWNEHEIIEAALP